MKKDTKILIQGGYGFRNWGDDLQLYNNVRILKEKGYQNITVMSPSDYIGELCKCHLVPSTHSLFPKMIKGNNKYLFEQFCLIDGALNNNKINLLNNKTQNLIKNIEKCDVFFFSGSGTINTRHLYGLSVFLTPLMIASHFGKRIILSGQGFSPMDNRVLEKFIGKIINKADKIFTRDFDLGLKELRKTGIDMTKVVKGIDDAFTTPKDKVILQDNSIGINISCFIVPRLYKNFYDLAVLLKKNGYNPIFNYFQSEKKLLETITKGDFPVYEFKNPREVVGFHDSCVGSMSMRYHSMILSIANRTPVIVLQKDSYQLSKIQAIVNETGIENLPISFAEITTEKMYERLMKAMETQPAKLEEINNNWRPKSNLAIQYMEGLE